MCDAGGPFVYLGGSYLFYIDDLARFLRDEDCCDHICQDTTAAQTAEKNQAQTNQGGIDTEVFSYTSAHTGENTITVASVYLLFHFCYLFPFDMIAFQLLIIL